MSCGILEAGFGNKLASAPWPVEPRGSPRMPVPHVYSISIQKLPVLSTTLSTMADTLALSEADVRFLGPFLPPHDHEHPQPSLSISPLSSHPLPFITLTYATSLDGRIAAAQGTRTLLSGPASKAMTHYLRKHHDAILIGVGTANADNPSLNCRYPDSRTHQPRPVIVDPNLRWRCQGAVVDLAEKGMIPQIWRISSGDSLPMPRSDGIEHLPLSPSAGSSRLAWRDMFALLGKHGVRSVMVEGGANVINSLLAEDREVALLGSVIVTVAPTWLGENGVAVSPAAPVVLADAEWRQFGADAVLCARLPQSRQ